MLKLTLDPVLRLRVPSPTRRALEELVDRSRTLEDVAAGVDAIPGLDWYKGAAHVAIHSKMADGRFNPTRWAIITEGAET